MNPGNETPILKFALSPWLKCTSSLPSNMTLDTCLSSIHTFQGFEIGDKNFCKKQLKFMTDPVRYHLCRMVN